MKQFDYNKYLKNNPLLKEADEKALVQKLMLRFPGEPVDTVEYVDPSDFAPYNKNLMIHYFGGKDINGYKSVIVGENPKTGEMAYWMILFDEYEADIPYGETDDPYGEPSGTL
jgi:hypothetical protein